MSWLKRRRQNWRIIIYEIRNWFFVKRLIRKHKKTADWEKFGLRADWVGRIYTVLNPQMPGDKGDTQEVLQLKYTDRLKPINLYLDSLGFGAAVAIGYEDIKESDAVLVVWYPIFEVITFWKVFWTITAIIVFFSTRLSTWAAQGIAYLLGFIF